MYYDTLSNKRIMSKKVHKMKHLKHIIYKIEDHICEM